MIGTIYLHKHTNNPFETAIVKHAVHQSVASTILQSPLLLEMLTITLDTRENIIKVKNVAVSFYQCSVITECTCFYK